MNLKRFTGALVILITFLGVIYQQQNTPPNQEIVLQFTDAHVTISETQHTLNLIKNQLHHLGAHNIRVKEIDGGILTITYYSTIEASHIKKNLIQKSYLLKGYSNRSQNHSSEKSPLKNDVVNYDVDVFLLKNTNDIKSNQLAAIFLELSADNQRILIPKILIFSPKLYDKNKNIGQETYKPSHDVILSDGKKYYHTLNVRAGPFV